jgi:hypothetical protein
MCVCWQRERLLMHVEVDGIRTHWRAQVLHRVAAATTEFAATRIYGNPVEGCVREGLVG